MFQFADMCSKLRINEACWLFHKYFIRQRAIEKGILYIQLSYGPRKLNYKRNDHANGGMSNHETKRFSIIKSRLLMISIHNKPSLKSVNGPIRFSFNFENPFVGKHIHWRMVGEQKPGASPLEGVKFICHCSSPFLKFMCLTITSRLRQSVSGGCMGILRIRLVNTIFGTGYHGMYLGGYQRLQNRVGKGYRRTKGWWVG